MSIEIKKKIDKYMSEMQDSFSAGTFVLNPEAEKINQKIFELRKQCKHKYDENNICIYCYLWKGGVE